MAAVVPTQTGAAAIGGLVGAARFRSGSGSAKEFSTLSHVIGGPEPWSWICPTDRQVASSAMTSIVLPPVRLNPYGGVPHPDPFELDWMFANAWINPEPETWIALHIVGLRAIIENGNVRSWRFVATAMELTGHCDRPMIPPKIDARLPWMSTSMNPGNAT